MPSTLETLTAALAGRYAIDRQIGAGGMATVYLAEDVRHKRRVAVKVLNPELGAVLGVERFLAEIQVTANLQHPNLLPLFDSGEASGLLFYVMPFVEGESLRARLTREKQLPVDEAIRLTTAIAGGLDYAHRHKVIHRDLKPENVLLHEGQPLIADFGIALAVSIAGGARVTQTGISLGTPQYMSPEQATGDRVVDGRTDIYSLGAMTYEMLVGDPPHNASTAQSIIAKVLTEKPASIRLTRPNVPAPVDAAVMRALEKLAADRFATAAEFADALRPRGGTTVSGAFASVPVPGRRLAVRTRRTAPWGLSAALAAALAWAILGRATVADAPIIRANFDLPAGVRVTDVLVGSTFPVSPRGDMVAFTAPVASAVTGYRIFVRRVDELSARGLADVAGRNLAFSPDGRWLAFTEGNLIKKVATDGGPVLRVGTSISATPYGLAWGPRDTLFVGSFSGLSWLPASGGDAVTLLTADSLPTQIGKRWPVFTPDSQALVVASSNSTVISPRLAVVTLAGRVVQEFQIDAAQPLGFVDNHLIYVTASGAVMALPFDPSWRRPAGDPVQVDDGVLVDPTGGAKAVLSASGTLAYLSGRAHVQPVHVGASGAPASGAPEPLMREVGSFAYPRYSPTGDRVAFTVVGANSTDIWVYHRGRNTFERLTSEGANVRPEWTPDGKRLLFVSTRSGKGAIWWQPADGSSKAELLYEPEVEPFEAVVSPDSKWLVFRTAPGARFNRDILAVPLTGERKVTELVTGAFSETMPRISPSGRWMAYQSTETGRFDVYVRPFPGSGARVQVSNDGGTEPVWGRDGRTLYYRSNDGGVVQVSVSTGEQFSIGARRVVVEGDFLMDASHPNYDVAPDGRLLMLRRAGAESQTVIVHNWAREARAKIAASR